MVLLKEEEDTQKLKEDVSKASKSVNEKVQPEPKLTRLKAKQLKQIPLPIASLNEPIPDDEVAALIREELNSDDDDEEYKPTEDEIVSDDDPNTTVSDVDSQPRTPASVASVVDPDNEPYVRYTKDGLFKIPKPRNDSQCSQSEQEQEQENIALRTRSKLCLTTTAIETLESTFIPPDITKDMYEYDGEMDQAWKDFLEEFTKPLPNNLEDDDDNDPEYVAAEGIPLDPEEMKTLKVSKKELNELVQELMEMGATDDQSLLEETLTKTINESLNSQMNDRDALLSTPVPAEESNCIDDTIQSTIAESNVSTMPEQLSSTAVLPPKPSVNEFVQTTEQLDTPGSGSGYNPTMYATECVQFPTHNDMPSISSSADDSDINGAASLQSTAIFSTISNETNSQNDSYNYTVLQNCTTQPKFLLKYNSLEETAGDELSPKRYRLSSTTVPVEVNVSETAPGMNDYQFKLLHQQLRMHVQLTAQHFLQTYGHPTMWQMAPKFKTMLTELAQIGRAKPNIVPWNLPLALDCCQSWENQLAVDDDNTKSLLKFWKDELDREEKERKIRRIYHSDFHWMVREKIINCRAFIYPSLIPYKAFRTCLSLQASGAYNCEKQYVEFFLC
ncbi:AGAP004472-PA [Anopheles gambiae str. PEST]|uniref:AGAP004472-PA n=1 Tax=Anopheles gambiae TaxID=7165 RepID=A0NDP9_ANOGA|nr:AGAP004472-PA [Anopheles gambiae str. PEST]